PSSCHPKGTLEMFPSIDTFGRMRSFAASLGLLSVLGLGCLNSSPKPTLTNGPSLPEPPSPAGKPDASAPLPEAGAETSVRWTTRARDGRPRERHVSGQARLSEQLADRRLSRTRRPLWRRAAKRL